MYSTEYGSGGDGFCKDGYLSVVKVLLLSVVCVMAIVVLMGLMCWLCMVLIAMVGKCWW